MFGMVQLRSRTMGGLEKLLKAYFERIPATTPPTLQIATTLLHPPTNQRSTTTTTTLLHSKSTLRVVVSLPRTPHGHSTPCRASPPSRRSTPKYHLTAKTATSTLRNIVSPMTLPTPPILDPYLKSHCRLRGVDGTFFPQRPSSGPHKREHPLPASTSPQPLCPVPQVHAGRLLLSPAPATISFISVPQHCLTHYRYYSPTNTSLLPPPPPPLVVLTHRP
ncbi:hypothetical protein BDQ17DRAFT_1434819 [Cyathus striatus]|nr:hypothetical protein BDQ17DRAFT_1434819 [Cyathus striatus]